MSAIIRRIIQTSTAPSAVGPYSQAVAVDRTLYVAGQIGFVPETMEIISGGAAKEAEQALKNIGYILKAAGTSYGNVVKTTVLMQDISDFAAVNEVYAKYFPSRQPARAAYQVAALPKGAKVEIEAIAILGEIKDE